MYGPHRPEVYEFQGKTRDANKYCKALWILHLKLERLITGGIPVGAEVNKPV